MATEQDGAQVGGNHYREVPDYLQHWNVVHVLGWDYYIGAATKYLWRLGRKAGEDPIEAIGKAIQFLQKKQELMIAELDMKKGGKQ